MAEDKSHSGLRVSNEKSRDNTESASDDTIALEDTQLEALGYKPELHRNRSLFTLLFQSLAIAAIPFGEGAPLLSAVYGGGQLAIFLGWIIVVILDECIALSLSEIASRYPTSAGPYYWSYQLAGSNKELLSFVTGWIWLVGNLNITLSVNFGFASLIAATVNIRQPDFILNSWQLLLVFYLILLITLLICTFFDEYLPMIDTICAAWTATSILIIMISLSSVAADGRHSAAYALGHYDTSFSGWGGFTFFIGLLPAAYVSFGISARQCLNPDALTKVTKTFSAIGMISSMSEQVHDPTIKMPRAISLCVPVGAIAGLFFIIPICVTLPPLQDIISQAPNGQALPYVFFRVMGTPAGGIGLTFLVLGVTMFCSISITTCAARTTWAFARDSAVPGSSFFSKLNGKSVPVRALCLVTIVQALLGLINLGSSAAFTGFTSAGVIGLALAYGVPISISVFNGRREVSKARWNCGPFIGWAVNIVSMCWITFELVLFSMPTALPVTPVSMNYASVIVVGFMALSAVWYVVYARKVYAGPPASDGIGG